VNGDAVNLREALLNAILKRSGDVVNLRNGERALHCAMAGNQNVVLYLAGAYIVAIHQLVELRGQGIQEFLDGALKLLPITETGIWSGDVAAKRLNVDIHVDRAIAQLANSVFKFRGLAVGVAQA